MIATLPLIVGATWSVIETRRRHKLAEDWAQFRTDRR
jgi:hypothetical protein